MEMTWHELVQRYAIHAREFSDAVAILGQEAHLRPEACLGHLDTARSKLDLCIAAADGIERYLKQQAKAADAT
jgi:hypothetical protein